MSNLIEVQSVNKTYKRGEETLVVLDELSLEVPKVTIWLSWGHLVLASQHF